MDWKKATKQYREVATRFARALQLERAMRQQEEQVVIAAKEYVECVTTPTTPFVELVTGESVESQEVQQKLIKAVADLEVFIQTYSQNTSQNPSEESLDNTLPV